MDWEKDRATKTPTTQYFVRAWSSLPADARDGYRDEEGAFTEAEPLRTWPRRRALLSPCTMMLDPLPFFTVCVLVHSCAPAVTKRPSSKVNVGKRGRRVVLYDVDPSVQRRDMAIRCKT